MKIVIINGKGLSGKDTIVEYVSNLLDGKYEVHNISSIDCIKEVAEILGWKGEKTEKDRKFLSDLKKLSVNYNDLPLNDMLYKINDIYLENTQPTITFVHIRESEEIEKLIKFLPNFFITTLLVKRTTYNLGNDSDDQVDKFIYDYTIENDSEFTDTGSKVKLWLVEKLKINENWNIE